MIEAISTRKKKNFCLYCKQSFTQLPRHFEKRHSEEADVKKFINLPKSEYPLRRLIAKNVLNIESRMKSHFIFVLLDGNPYLYIYN